MKAKPGWENQVKGDNCMVKGKTRLLVIILKYMQTLIYNDAHLKLILQWLVTSIKYIF